MGHLKEYLKLTNSKNVLAVIIIGLVITGCGGQGPNSELPSQDPGKDPLAPPSGGVTFTQPSPNPSTSPVPNNDNSIPPLSFPIKAVGYNPMSITVSTRNILKVRFTPGIQSTPIKVDNANSNFYANYSKLGVYIKVGSLEMPTPLLKNGFDGSTAEGSSIMDYSKSFTKTCNKLDSFCQETVTITVNKPNYDYWCLNFGTYCPNTHVWETHPWNGTLEVQTDDSGAL